MNTLVINIIVNRQWYRKIICSSLKNLIRCTSNVKWWSIFLAFARLIWFQFDTATTLQTRLLVISLVKNRKSHWLIENKSQGRLQIALESFQINVKNWRCCPLFLWNWWNLQKSGNFWYYGNNRNWTIALSRLCKSSVDIDDQFNFWLHLNSLSLHC